MHFIKDLEPKKIKKGTILLRQGEHCKASYRVIKGCLRSYVIDKAGKEHIFQFAPENWMIGDADSILNNKPAIISIDAIEDSEVIILHKERLIDFFNQDQPVLAEQLQLLLRNVIATNKRLISLLSATSEERYLSFVETYPALLQRLPLKLIASYLGMTPEYLSEVRRKLTKK